MSELGERVNQLRRMLDWNQEKLAKEANLTQATISRIERGLKTSIRHETVVRLADALGVPVDSLTFDEEPSEEDAILKNNAVREMVKIYLRLSSTNRAEALSYLRYLDLKEKGDPFSDLPWDFENHE